MSTPSLSASLTHRMNHLVARQGIISGNIANATTPGYITRDLSFNSLLTQVPGIGVATTHRQHLRGKNTGTTEGKLLHDKTHMRNDGNSVKMDVEMLKMNEIQLHYRMVTQLYSKHAGFQRLALGRQQ